ncbi:RICIN domain-containing protein [Pyxidicoccus sp. MSG2]|uniref:RICIN domain-containing protein n=1 Tax=Pyxidicoccus sp. MSG2 TaxID=2996790 RepID=UPI003B63F4DF
MVVVTRPPLGLGTAGPTHLAVAGGMPTAPTVAEPHAARADAVSATTSGRYSEGANTQKRLAPTTRRTQVTAVGGPLGGLARQAGVAACHSRVWRCATLPCGDWKRRSGATGNGACIQQAPCSGLSKQLWRRNSKGSGRYEIVAVNGGRCLDVTGGPTATGDGVLMALWDCSDLHRGAQALYFSRRSENGRAVR